MLTRQGDARTKSSDRLLAWSLAGIAGAANAAGFYAAGHYVSHMTGAVSALADQLVLGEPAGIVLALGVIVLFIAGAASSALLISLGLRRGLTGIYAFSVLAEAVLLAALAWLDMLVPGPLRGLILILGLSFLMGLQNAIVTRLSGARIRTTHVTGMVTDIGIELGHLMDRAVTRGAPGSAKPDLDKLALHVPTVGSFFVGGLLGVFGYRAMGQLFLLIPAACLMALAIRGLRASPDQ
ncbi:YoaK family protein [Indioceanicola profundi]|uniref:YoaK family protein n=1 Tax=Indioceanicola profundi TaxID=2220096 RepID=UPI000E6AAC2E|nr:YoaK family protein [Indioceanicola profundi]